MRTRPSPEDTTRRIRDGHVLVSRQAGLMECLALRGHGNALPVARDLLSTMLKSLDLMRASRALQVMAGRDDAHGAGPCLPAPREQDPQAGTADLVGLLLHAILRQESGATAVFAEVLGRLDGPGGADADRTRPHDGRPLP